ncbi:NADH-quinone oxidoreductase subunit L [Terracidiphilus sp.]|jgi:NADH-quinone oxidoreductase subunit L|uniref:NADH-quinone oxidoreductase subunit L n=1 Tax=Terracidiphilus sp. TaxID=1964191 RepID=UPI003C2305D2
MMQGTNGFALQTAASGITQLLWLIPAIPMVAAGVIALLKQPARKLAATLAIGSLALSLLLALVAFSHVLSGWTSGHNVRETANFTWLQFGTSTVDLGWVLDPLSAVMLVMVTFVGLLIVIYSTGYMAHDENFTRFFCFLSLFAGAMLGVVIANSLLLLFMCWELVGLTSYLLIGFWYQKPSAAAAAKKAFLTTRVGDIFFLLGIVWLFAQTGTLLFYNSGAGSMEPAALNGLLAAPAALGLSAATVIGLLIFAGAAGKSGQLPLHVWLPDAMEGPTPVSALIHAATMVAAGVYLIARVYPLMQAGTPAGGITTALTVVTWVGAATAVFAALIAVAQDDIKRILAYSTVSQLGYMMAGLGLGGVAVGMFHLITHAFFKALLFMGAGSVIHGVHEEQDVRKMGGLRKAMPLTFATYAIGMLALSGFPIVFSGFWSKDGILAAAKDAHFSRGPFYLLVFGAVLTAFYMTRQVSYVFFGKWRGHGHAHESPAVMTAPLAILAFFAIALGVIGTPAWPWFRSFLEGHAAAIEFGKFGESEFLVLLLTSTLIVLVGLGFGWLLYGSKSPAPEERDVLEKAVPPVWAALRNRLYVDEFYGVTFIAFYKWWAEVADWLDRRVWGGIVALVIWVFGRLAHFDRFFDNEWVNGGFDKGCEELYSGGGLLARVQSGRTQTYLRLLAVAVVVLAVILIWSSRP